MDDDDDDDVAVKGPHHHLSDFASHLMDITSLRTKKAERAWRRPHADQY